jgi:hypothetical protein
MPFQHEICLVFKQCLYKPHLVFQFCLFQS